MICSAGNLQSKVLALAHLIKAARLREANLYQVSNRCLVMRRKILIVQLVQNFQYLVEERMHSALAYYFTQACLLR